MYYFFHSNKILRTFSNINKKSYKFINLTNKLFNEYLNKDFE